METGDEMAPLVGARFGLRRGLPRCGAARGRARFSALRAPLRQIGVDRAVLFAVAGNIVAFVIGPVTAFLVATRFTPTLQGYYYTFGSLTTLQFLFEVGLGQAVVQFASHEWAHLHFSADGEIVGDPGARDRLASLARISFLWYGLAGTGACIALFVLGALFFGPPSQHGVQWTDPWAALCVGVGLNLAIIPAFYLMQGCSLVNDFWAYRMAQQAIAGLALCASILLGLGLWAGSISTLLGVGWGLAFVWWRFPSVVQLLRPPATSSIKWARDVWPVQWRVAISWLSATLTTQAFAPILFKAQGPALAGRMGMTVTLCNVLIAISSNWVVTKGPRFGVLVARRDYYLLDSLFRNSQVASIVVASGGATCIWGTLFVLRSVQSSLAGRVLPLDTVALLLATSAVSASISGLAVYLRAHKREPLAMAYLAGAALTVAAAGALARPFGAAGVATGYALAVTCVQLPISVLIFRRCRSRWHAIRGAAFGGVE